MLLGALESLLKIAFQYLLLSLLLRFFLLGILFLVLDALLFEVSEPADRRDVLLGHWLCSLRYEGIGKGLIVLEDLSVVWRLQYAFVGPSIR